MKINIVDNKTKPNKVKGSCWIEEQQIRSKESKNPMHKEASQGWWFGLQESTATCSK